MVKCHRDNIETNFQLNQNDYIINSHGGSIYNPSYPNEHFDPLKSEIQYLKLPSNIEIHMYTDMFDDLSSNIVDSESINYSICQIRDPKIKHQEKRIPYNVFKNCFFPNIFFASDDKDNIFRWYSGILHCQSNCVIYNIDGVYQKDHCITSHIKPRRKGSSFQYIIEKNNYLPNAQNWDRCGSIDLANAIPIITKFNQQVLHNHQVIKIHLKACSGCFPMDNIRVKRFNIFNIFNSDKKFFLKILMGYGNQNDIDQFNHKNKDIKRRSHLALYWKKKMPSSFKHIYDQKPKGKIYQYYLDNINNKYYIQFIFRSEYTDQDCINFLFGIKKIFYREDLYQRFNYLKKNITFDFTSNKYFYQKKKNLTNTELSFYQSVESFNQFQFNKVCDLMKQIIIQKIDKLLQQVSKITEKNQSKIVPKKSKTIKKTVSE